ncbi:hypothetical protein [Paenibacillus ginsengihumi]|uniref:hypothetical protein n=1 Tax=Paenibacillus ginsengihumi TaxID=431596 RepID=UPI00037FA40B|nr:hypothetical protein [Paenibacillus ginsengihumi]
MQGKKVLELRGQGNPGKQGDSRALSRRSSDVPSAGALPQLLLDRFHPSRINA